MDISNVNACFGCREPELPIVDGLCGRCRARKEELASAARLERVIERFERLVIAIASNDGPGVSYAALWAEAEEAEAFIESRRDGSK